MRLFKAWVYGAGWGVWLALCLFAPLMGSVRYNLGLLLYFVALEMLALLDGDPGDTLSEHVWMFYGERPARLWLVAGFVIYLQCMFLALVFGGVLNKVGFVPLGLGLGMWLWDHFRSMGRLG